MNKGIKYTEQQVKDKVTKAFGNHVVLISKYINSKSKLTLKCINCDTAFTRAAASVFSKTGSYCPNYCYTKKEVKKKYCLYCNKELVGKRKKYCNHKCHADHRYKKYINDWKNSKENGMKGKTSISGHVKRYLFDKYDNKCAECGLNTINKYTGNIPLEIHHIDGKFDNNIEDNLILLCPNCYSLTSTYKNRGFGGRDR